MLFGGTALAILNWLTAVFDAPIEVRALYVLGVMAFCGVIVLAVREVVAGRRARKINKLTALREDGVRLRNERFSTNEALIAWVKEWEAWDRSVISELERVGAEPSDVAWFKTLDTISNPKAFEHAINGNHATHLAWLSEKLERLLTIVRQLDE